MFQFPGFASLPYVFRQRYRVSGGFPHSEISGSKPAHGSPKLIAACHVLHRLYVPRHPPNALISLETRHVLNRCQQPADAGRCSFSTDALELSFRHYNLHSSSLCKSRYLSFTMSKTARIATSFSRKTGNGFRSQSGPGISHLLTPSIVHGIDPLPVPASRGSKGMVGLGRLELPTSRLSGVRSNQLSYRPQPCISYYKVRSVS